MFEPSLNLLILKLEAAPSSHLDRLATPVSLRTGDKRLQPPKNSSVFYKHSNNERSLENSSIGRSCPKTQDIPLLSNFIKIIRSTLTHFPSISTYCWCECAKQVTPASNVQLVPQVGRFERVALQETASPWIDSARTTGRRTWTQRSKVSWRPCFYWAVKEMCSS